MSNSFSYAINSDMTDFYQKGYQDGKPSVMVNQLLYIREGDTKTANISVFLNQSVSSTIKCMHARVP